jgi:hypothetical protein
MQIQIIIVPFPLIRIISFCYEVYQSLLDNQGNVFPYVAEFCFSPTIDWGWLATVV